MTVSDTVAAAGALCGILVLAGGFMYATRPDTARPTVEQAWAWSYRGCLKSEQYIGTESYRPCGKCSEQDRSVIRTRCLLRSDVGAFYPDRCLTLGFFSGRGRLQPVECSLALRHKEELP